MRYVVPYRRGPSMYAARKDNNNVHLFTWGDAAHFQKADAATVGNLRTLIFSSHPAVLWSH